MSKYGGACSRNSVPQRAEEVCESGFAEGAEREAGEGNPKLHAGDNAVKIGDECFDDPGANVAFCDELADSGQPHSNEREFGCGEESVENNEEEYADQANDEHTVGMLLCCIVSGGRTWLTSYERMFLHSTNPNLHAEESPGLRFFGDPYRIASE